MLFAVAPAVDLPIYDLRQAVEIVELTPLAQAAADLCAVCLKVEGDMVRLRRVVGIQMHTINAGLLSAEEQGQRLDCASLIEALSARYDQDQINLGRIIKKLTSICRRAVASKLQGAGTMNSYALRVSAAVRGWLNDLEDHRETVAVISKRMAKMDGPKLSVEAGRAYQDAVQAIFNTESSSELVIDPSLGGPYVRLNVGLPKELLVNVDRLLSLEDKVHEHVRENTPEVFGQTALSYYEI